MHLNKILILMILAFGTSISADAQKFLDRLQKVKSGEGTVTVSQSKELDELVNGKSQVTAKSGTSKPDVSKANSKTPTPKPHHETATKPSRTAENEASSSTETNVDTRKKVIRNGQKVTGYRVQVFSGGNSRVDKEKANEIGSRLKALFPDQPIYVHFYNPRWICRMGNYRTYQDAENMLREVKAMGYKQACIVKGQITVQE